MLKSIDRETANTTDLNMADPAAMFEIMLRQNMRCISLFHDNVLAALNEKLSTILEDPDLVAWQTNWITAEFKINYPAKLRESCFLTMFGHFEEMLKLLWRRYHGQCPQKQSPPQTLKGYNRFFATVLNQDNQTNPYMTQLKEAQIIRNCLLHAGGNLSLDSKATRSGRTSANDICIKRRDHYSIKGNRVIIERQGLSNLQIAISSITKELNRKLLHTNISYALAE